MDLQEQRAAEEKEMARIEAIKAAMAKRAKEREDQWNEYIAQREERLKNESPEERKAREKEDKEMDKAAGALMVLFANWAFGDSECDIAKQECSCHRSPKCEIHPAVGIKACYKLMEECQ